MRKLILVGFIAGCGGSGGGGETEIDATLVFADRTDAEISRLVSAASAIEAFGAQSQVGQFDEPDDPCPTVVEDAASLTVTITGGCTRASDSITINGSATLHNPAGWGELEHDFMQPSEYEFDGFEIVFSTGVVQLGYTGRFEIRPNFAGYDIDLTTEQVETLVRSDLFLSCGLAEGGQSTQCTHGASGLELVGVGGARVSGTMGANMNGATADMTLQGVDSVSFTLGNGCLRWELDGTDRSFQQGQCP